MRGIFLFYLPKAYYLLGMKLFILCLVLFVGFIANAQEKAFGKNDISISAGYGIGNVWRDLFKVNGPSGSDYNVSINGPYTLIGEYAFSRRISGGLALAYSKLRGIFTYGGYKNTETLTNYSILLRANYHFWHFLKWDPYVGGGAGYYKFNYASHDNTVGSNQGSGLKIPGSFALAAQAGVKYYPLKQVGLFAEVGYVAGSIGQAGVVVKLR